MKPVLNRLRGVKLVTKPAEKLCEKDWSEKATEKNSITSGFIEPGVWIMSGLLLSLVTQIAYVSRRDRKW
jgi:hypothetical protein